MKKALLDQANFIDSQIETVNTLQLHVEEKERFEVAKETSGQLASCNLFNRNSNIPFHYDLKVELTTYLQKQAVQFLAKKKIQLQKEFDALK